MIEYISDELVDQYLDRVFALRVSKAPVEKSDLKVVYTPLNGTGNKLVRRILQRIGIENIAVVPGTGAAERPLPDLPISKPGGKIHSGAGHRAVQED